MGSLGCFFFPKPPRAFWTPALNFLSEDLNCLLLFVSDPLRSPPPDPLANVVGAKLLELLAAGPLKGWTPLLLNGNAMLIRLPGPAMTVRLTVLKAPAIENGPLSTMLPKTNRKLR